MKQTITFYFQDESEDNEVEEGEGIYSRDEIDFDENMIYNEVEVVDLMDTDEE
ncbi:16021_t:CDS:2, partial [Gigaspora rosea]